MREKVLLLLFGMCQELAEIGWDGFIEQGVPGFFEGRAGAFAYPVQVGVQGQAWRAASVDGFGLRILGV